MQRAQPAQPAKRSQPTKAAGKKRAAVAKEVEADASRCEYPRGDALIGRRIKVYWEGDGKWFKGRVASYDPEDEVHTVVYDDGDQRYYTLFDE